MESSNVTPKKWPSSEFVKDVEKTDKKYTFAEQYLQQWPFPRNGELQKRRLTIIAEPKAYKEAWEAFRL